MRERRQVVLPGFQLSLYLASEAGILAFGHLGSLTGSSANGNFPQASPCGDGVLDRRNVRGFTFEIFDEIFDDDHDVLLLPSTDISSNDAPLGIRSVVDLKPAAVGDPEGSASAMSRVLMPLKRAVCVFGYQRWPNNGMNKPGFFADGSQTPSTVSCRTYCAMRQRKGPEAPSMQNQVVLLDRTPKRT
ncbi:hypothetical protein BDW66DRAFT_130691 [Aspergillus desertorum]